MTLTTEPPGFELVVCIGPAVRCYPLPATGTIVLGRADDADVRVDDASVSRRHASIHLGSALAIEDLGSANGTRFLASGVPGRPETWDLAGKRLEPGIRMSLKPGQNVLLGSVTVAVHPGDSAAARAVRAPHASVALHTPDVVVVAPAMRTLYETAARVAASHLSVLLLGETGVGKEVLAEAIHAGSARAQGPMLRLNCAALSETLLESELFGHERGAFTGAVAGKAGLFESAQGGTVFLDEIGELPATTQVKLLRVLEDRKVLRVGAVRPIDIDVRFVAATHRDLREAIERGAFRQDLFFRLAGVVLTIPPLRERRDEFDAMVASFAARAARQMNRADPPRFSSAARAALAAHAWPGNLRELRNVIERAVVLAHGTPIEPAHLGLEPPRAASVPPPPSTRPPPVPSEPPVAVAQSAPATPLTLTDADIEAAIAARERQRILEALERAAGNQTTAAQLLGISRRTLVSRLSEHNLPRPRKPRPPQT